MQKFAGFLEEGASNDSEVVNNGISAFSVHGYSSETLVIRPLPALLHGDM